MDADGGNVHQVAMMADWRWHGSPAASNDGQRIAFDADHGRGDEFHIFVTNLADGTTKDLGPGACPHWSPDDKQLICFRSENLEAGGEPGLWIMNADGQARERIGPQGLARWSPDGSQIAVTGWADGNVATIFLYDVISGERTRMITERFANIHGAPAWSADGERLAFIASRTADGPQDLIIARVAKPEAPLKVRHRGFLRQLSWSPAKQIVLSGRANSTDADQLCIIDPDNDAEPKVVLNPTHGRFNQTPCWSPDAKKIYFLSDRDRVR
jgi:Tol biopolymer transport system component